MNTVKLIGLGCCMLFGFLLNPINTMPEYINVVFAEETAEDKLEEHIIEIKEDIEDFTKYLVEIDTFDIKETYISEEIQTACIEIGYIYNICPEFLMAIIETESSGNPNAENGTCKGLMQISERWHQDRMRRLGVTNIYDVYGNILLGADYISELQERYEDIGLILMIYNGDSKANDYKNGTVPISKYAEKILNRAADLERLHGK